MHNKLKFERLHIPVLLTEVIENMRLNSGVEVADLTFGEGGHSEAILGFPVKTLIANDRDLVAISRYKEAGKLRSDERLCLSHGCFSTFLERSPISKFDAILVDLGVSTRQLLEAERGFSLMNAGPLDMRMDQQQTETLQGFLETLTTEELANELFRNAELRDSRRLARKIIEEFRANRLNSTLELANVAGKRQPGKSHPATALFTALRMMVNNELDEITSILPKLMDALKPQGRLVVISFHSTEDRLIKQLFAKAAGRCICDERICLCPRNASVRLITSKPMVAGPDELNNNPRARSAKLRCVEKL